MRPPAFRWTLALSILTSCGSEPWPRPAAVPFEQFLAEHLGGRAEPVGDAFAGSSIKIPVGGEQVAGVAGAYPSN